MLSQFFLSNPLQLFLENGNWLQWTAFLVLSIFLQQVWFRFLTKKGLFQRIYELSPSSHQQKSQTPSLGGIMILLTMLLGGFVFSFFSDKVIWLMSLMLYFGVIGGLDDGMSVFLKRNKGLSVKQKFGLQLFGALGFLLVYSSFFEPLSLLNIAFYLFIIVGSSNATNLTDGLDGLAIMPVIIAGASLGIIAYIVGRADYSSYLDVHYIRGGGEILIFSSALIGSGLGFLWYNAPPAAVFMGDTGSLSLGSALGCIAVSIKHELVLFIVGGLFVIETLSVIIQVLFFKITGKRVFLMAPIHHHFEKLGWSESQIVIRFWIIAVILAALGMSTLKLR